MGILQKLAKSEMKNSPIPIIYLLGAGRSGTTILATVMNAHPKVQTVGELHQYFDHISGANKCSCGNDLANCEFWGAISHQYSDSLKQLSNWRQICKEKEAHSNIPKYLVSKKEVKVYSNIQERLFSTISEEINKNWILDSSKYIGRYLLLKRNKNLQLKGIYVVRDVRGVITSFKKQVQTFRNPLSTIFYYLIVNATAQWVCWTDHNVTKVRYEDFMEDPEKVLRRVYDKISLDLNEEVSLPEEFVMPHIIGGNRMRSQNKIKLLYDVKWKWELSMWQKTLYYCLASPIMLLNGYKI